MYLPPFINAFAVGRLRCALLMTLGVVTSASARANDIHVSITDRVLLGQELPAVEITAARSVRDVVLRLRAQERHFEQRSGALSRGKTFRFVLDVGPGTTSLSGTLRASFADGGEGELPLSFDVTVASPLRIEVPYERMDLAVSKLWLRLSEAANRCEYLVAYDDGEVEKGEAVFAGEPAGTWLPVTWRARPEGMDAVVLKIALMCYDPFDFYSGIELFPWRLDIPHEEVLFASGKSEIAPHEHPKLDAALHAIEKAVQRYGTIISIRLYIVGHTDTVGAASSNIELSRRRAQAIAKYFRNAGVRLPTYHAGLGESEPLVPTPDETDEPKNRRADYVLAVRPPRDAPWEQAK